MYEVLALEKQSVLWRTADTTKFEDVLREEAGVCTPSRFRSFKKANECFNRTTINKLGVPCVCLLAKQPANVRDRVLRNALKFREQHGAEPTYQYVSRLCPHNSTPQMSRTKLLAYIEKLKGVIKDCGARVPPMD
jgi:hypothetical protein